MCKQSAYNGQVESDEGLTYSSGEAMGVSSVGDKIS